MQPTLDIVRNQLAKTFAAWPRPVVILDLESTGSAGGGRITEVAFMHFEEGTATLFSTLINPEVAIPRFITHLTGIDDAMVKNAPLFSDIADALFRRLQGKVLIAHNSRFDYGLLKAEFKRCGIHYAAPTLCSVKWSRLLYPAEKKHSLDSIIERFAMNISDRHRAMSDVEAVALFLNASLATQTEAWQAAACKLIQPAWLPKDIVPSLSETLYCLPPKPGLLFLLDCYKKPLWCVVLDNLFHDFFKAALKPNIQELLISAESAAYFVYDY